MVSLIFKVILFAMSWQVSASASASAYNAALAILNRQEFLSATDFADLREVALQQDDDSEVSCETQKDLTVTSVPSVFSDRVFEQRFANHPIFQRLNTFLYFSDANQIVPIKLRDKFIKYAKQFFLLVELGGVQEPNLTTMSMEGVLTLSDYYSNSDRKPILFTRPSITEGRFAYDYIHNHDLALKSGAGTQRFSQAMIETYSSLLSMKPLCGMSEFEAAALGSYIGLGFRKLNKYLRSGRQRYQPFDQFESLINQALSKLSDWKGVAFRTTTLLQQADMPESVYREHKMQSIVVYKAFTSTSTYPITNANFLILSKTGKKLGPLSAEGEVLFASNTKFKVHYNSCEVQNLTLWQGCQIILEELE